MTGKDRFVKITLAVGRNRIEEGVTGRQREAAKHRRKDAEKDKRNDENQLTEASIFDTMKKRP